MNQDFNSAQNKFDDIDLGKIFRFILMQSKLIVLIVLTVFVLAYTQYSFSTKKYLIQSLLKYESYDQNIFNPSDLIKRSTSTSSDIYQLIALYESRTNYLKVIEDMNLNVDIQGLENDEHIDIKITPNESKDFDTQQLKFYISELNYTILDDDLNEIQTVEFGDEISHNGLTISILSSNLKKYRPITIFYNSPESQFNSLKSSVNLDSNMSRNSYWRNEGLITVSYETENVNLGKEIINYANKVFLNQRIYDETEKSRKAINFIDKSLVSIEESVESNKRKLKKFREKNNSIDVNLEIQGIIKKLQSLEETLQSIDIEIAQAEKTYTLNNPIYINLINEKNLIDRQKQLVLSEIEMMPQEQQEYIDLYNNLEISQKLFEELESRRLGFSILEASTISDIRVVDDAYVLYQVSPKFFNVIITTLISFIIACFVAIIRGFNFLPLSNPAEILDNKIYTPVIGVIPYVEKIETINDNVGLNSSIESLILNINSLNKIQTDKNLITITSPTPFNGKSSVSIKLAEGFAKVGNKVLLVDNDLKRGKINKNFNIRSISEKTFNSIDENTINNFLVKDNFYMIPRVKGLNNSFHFLYGYHYKEKIKFFKDNFDYVIFDTGPILSVAETAILNAESDINILIARHGVNKANEIKQCIDNLKQINKDFDGIIYNAYSRPKSYYGYYGLYGNYSYQYYADKYLDDTYEYDEDN